LKLYKKQENLHNIDHDVSEWADRAGQQIVQGDQAIDNLNNDPDDQVSFARRHLASVQQREYFLSEKNPLRKDVCLASPLQ
jgi:hypothetical protein